VTDIGVRVLVPALGLRTDVVSPAKDPMTVGVRVLVPALGLRTDVDGAGAIVHAPGLVPAEARLGNFSSRFAMKCCENSRRNFFLTLAMVYPLQGIVTTVTCFC